jgi:hypothetical protein
MNNYLKSALEAHYYFSAMWAHVSCWPPSPKKEILKYEIVNNLNCIIFYDNPQYKIFLTQFLMKNNQLWMKRKKWFVINFDQNTTSKEGIEVKETFENYREYFIFLSRLELLEIVKGFEVVLKQLKSEEMTSVPLSNYVHPNLISFQPEV